MNKKTLVLIIFLFLVTIGVLYLALVNPTKNLTTTSVPTPTPASVNAHTILTIDKASASESSALAPYTLAVHIDTGDNAVNSVQMEMSYDAKALTNVTIYPGDFFLEPSPLLNNIDRTNGHISYALAEQIDLSGKKGSGTLALLSFAIAPGFSGKTTISLLPKTAVAADKIMESVLKKATGYTLTISK